MRNWTMVAVAAVFASAPLAAQQEGHAAHPMPAAQHGAMQHCAGMMGGPHPQMLLHHADALELSAEQKARVEGLQERAREEAAPHMEPAMQAHRAAVEALAGDAPDFAAYEARLREAADHMVQAHTAMARVAVETGQVLTDDQRTTLSELGRGGMMGGAQRGAQHEGQHGMMRGGEHAGGGHAGMAGMMAGCMMMEKHEGGAPHH